MCGIIGAFDRQRAPLGDELARAACQRIAHRGPDDEGFFEADGMLIGNRRLSILDLAGGHQPMFSDDGQVAVVQNGEIYNFVELARGLGCRTTCDTEVLLRLYEREGDDFVRRLNGMFAIAIVDRRRRRLVLYRDRVGKKPLYLHDDGRRLLFASEIKSLLAMGVRPRLDWQALDALLTYNFVPPPVTLFEGVRHLMPGEMLAIDDAGVRTRRWWQLADAEPEEKSPDAWCDEILETLDDAVRIRLRSDVPLGAFLSGGIDSSSVVALMSRQLDQPPRTFCIGFSDPRFDESPHAAAVAERFGTRHTCERMQPDLMAVTIFESSYDFEERLLSFPTRLDVIFLDIHIRPYSGFEMLEIIRSQGDFAEIPVVAITASVMNEEVQTLRNAGFDGVFSKPLDLDMFPDLLRRVLEGERVWYVM